MPLPKALLSEACIASIGLVLIGPGGFPWQTSHVPDIQHALHVLKLHESPCQRCLRKVTLAHSIGYSLDWTEGSTTL